MGVESKFYVLPNTSGFRPSAERVVELITRFRKAAYVCDPNAPSFEPSVHRCPPALRGLTGYEGFDWRVGPERGVGSLIELEKRMAQHDGADIQIRWPTTDLVTSRLQYPLTQIPSPEDVYYDVKLHLAADTVYHTSDIIDPFDEPIRCSCGLALNRQDSPAHDFFYSARLPNHCLTCGKAANYAVLPMTFRNAWTGAETPGHGGITYHFCAIIDVGKMIPDEGTTVLADFRQIIEECLECQTRVVQDFY